MSLIKLMFVLVAISGLSAQAEELTAKQWVEQQIAAERAKSPETYDRHMADLRRYNAQVPTETVIIIIEDKRHVKK